MVDFTNSEHIIYTRKKIIAKKSITSVIGERRLLATLRNDFLVNMVQSFQDRETLFLVMDYLPGGDLRHHLSEKRYFKE